jgi:hypothetical protein
MSENVRPFRVLTIDGGGMRGFYSATVLQKLARHFDPCWGQNDPDLGRAFDLICGTSTGSILACGLTSGIPLRNIRDLYVNQGPSIFPRPKPLGHEHMGIWPIRLKALWKWGLRHIASPSANAANLQEALEKQFAQETLGKVHKRRKIALCIPTVNAANHQSVVLKTPHIPDKHLDNDWTLANACMASSAAPVFMPIYKAPHPDGEPHSQYYADGGLWANNPVLVGLIEALHMTKGKRAVEIVSVGTCGQPTGGPLDRTERGLFHWTAGIGILDMSMSAQVSGFGFMANLLAQGLRETGLDVRILRLKENPASPEEYSAMGLDRADQRAVQTMNNLAERDAACIHSASFDADTPEAKILKPIFNHLTNLN